MARPAKATATQSRNTSKEERENRQAAEIALRGGCNRIRPPAYLTKQQSAIFKWIVKELKASGILGNLDVYVLAQGSIVIDRMQTIEDSINRDPALLHDSKYMASKDKYSKEFWRFCSEMSLSPQSRAKMANVNVNVQKDEEDPLLRALTGGNNGP